MAALEIALAVTSGTAFGAIGLVFYAFRGWKSALDGWEEQIEVNRELNSILRNHFASARIKFNGD